MHDKLKKRTYVLVAVLLSLGIFYNYTSWQNAALGGILAIAYILFCGTITGTLIVSRPGWNILFGVLELFASIALIGAAFIFFHVYTPWLVLTIVPIIPTLLFVPYYAVDVRNPFSLRQFISEYRNKFNERREPKYNIVFAILYTCLAFVIGWLIFIARTDESIQSPWEVIHPIFFIIYALASAVLIAYITNARRTKLPLGLIVVHSLLSVSIATVVYTIGYGFDPFIHYASEKIIIASGGITPTPLYYLGQYAIVIFLHIISTIDVSIIDRWLVPILYSVAVPLTTYYVFSRWLKRTDALLLSAAMLIIPFSGFIMTTPQNLANVFFILVILLSLLFFRNEFGQRAISILALATLAIHPLAGIPLILTLTLFALFKGFYSTYKHYPVLYLVTALAFITIMPLAFLLIGAQPSLNATAPWNGVIPGRWADGGDIFLDVLYIISWNQGFLAAAGITVGLWSLSRAKLLKNNIGYLAAAGMLLCNYIIAKYFLSFPALRDYDQDSFVSRLATLSFYILLPFFMLGFFWILKRLWNAGKLARSLTVGALAGLMTCAVYISYPHINNYEPAKFFSVGRGDLEAVKTIEQNAAVNHVVLANQMVSAAAIYQLGFKQYIGDQFYYSIPSGEDQSLYNLYLDMVYNGATRKTMEQAMDIAGSNEAYFVLNRYWRNFDKIAADAKASADVTTSIDDGRVYVFTYKR